MSTDKASSLPSTVMHCLALPCEGLGHLLHLLLQPLLPLLQGGPLPTACHFHLPYRPLLEDSWHSVSSNGKKPTSNSCFTKYTRKLGHILIPLSISRFTKHSGRLCILVSTHMQFQAEELPTAKNAPLHVMAVRPALAWHQRLLKTAVPGLTPRTMNNGEWPTPELGKQAHVNRQVAVSW